MHNLIHKNFKILLLQNILNVKYNIAVLLYLITKFSTVCPEPRGFYPDQFSCPVASVLFIDQTSMNEDINS
ncbi:hypothetical protein T4B_15426 [Trichinella pseudospiralis]|uniref:Uncharacterized protein n=1 Tax=Trichinella pseudospiralis TaxID=6337 RepID=A0A0V1JHP8_TRIPS|nr:hypothetical protein T4A_3058 [Trichinella pseudospiralis]KRZ34515.1 hypothetical protein T4B_15426 [Trichinella pseudospiralis]KRZ45479.1 hypothetical protein T4C_13494 [Trichinella pseudospiralis]